jgi:glucose/arabinose dehydrogenase/mono/diheme cytochrome c family protein
MRRLLPLVLAVSVSTLSAQQGDRQGEVQQPVPAHIVIPPSPILTPEEALATLKAAPGYRVELVAADPLIHDPVAMTFGPDGRIWVAEMRGYMQNADGIGEDAKIGTIAVLADTDGDGRMDQRTVFAEGLVMPRALSLVDGGLLVAEPPHLWFMRDTNGDGKADTKTEVASDYGQAGNPEHTANGLLRALDNWIYSAKHDVRFRYLGDGKFTRENTVARGQWGIAQDNYGRLHHNTNSDPLQADVVPAEFLLRNPNLAQPEGIRERVVPADLRIWPGRVTPGVNRGYQILNEEGKIDAMTAASGPLVYRGALFPAGFRDNAFVPEPSANLVKRIAIEDRADGTRVGRNVYDGAEFLVSTDERFRPVNVYEGPDGGIYVVDIYRGILQHRIFLTTFLRRQIEERGLDKGIGLGRIYRIVPENARPSREAFDLSKESSGQLVARLSSPGGWWRDTAQRLLVERRDPSATPALRALARNPDADPLGRLHALWTLEGTGQLDRETLLAALNATDAHVRADAVRLAEPFLAEPDLAERVISLASDNSAHPRVVLHAALVLGSSKEPASLETFAKIARLHGEKPYLAGAVVSGLAGREAAFIDLVAADSSANKAASVVALAASAVLRSKNVEQSTALFARLDPASSSPDWVRSAVLDGVQQFLPRGGGRGRTVAVATTLPAEPKGLVALAAAKSHSASERAAAILPSLQWPGKEGFAAPVVAARMNRDQRALFEKGQAQYAMLCAACHQPNGQGMPGLAPQLVNSRYVVGPSDNLARIILNGKEGGGLMMPPLGSLDDEAIAGVMTYLRRSWGHTASTVTPAAVKKVREDSTRRTQPWTDEELLALAKE